MTPEDLQGIKLRVPGGVWRVKMFQAYGATPSPMEFKEVFVALQTGVMDGQENPFTQIYPAKFQEVQKYLSLTGHVYTPAYLTAGAELDASCRRTCARCSKTRPTRSRGGRPGAANALTTRCSVKMKRRGLPVERADKPAFVKASTSDLYDEFAKQVKGGQELIDKSLALAQEGRAS